MSSSLQNDHVRPVCVVLGGGVTGLTTALRLIEQGWEVHVVAEEIGGRNGVTFASSTLAQTPSNGAGAVWEFPPYKVEPQERAREWLLQGRVIFDDLANDVASGVHMRPQVILGRKDVQALEKLTKFNSWSFVQPEFTSGLVSDVVAGKYNAELTACVLASDTKTFTSFTFCKSPLVFMGRYLHWLYVTAVANGCVMHVGRVDDFTNDVHRRVGQTKTIELVVNCLGLHASTSISNCGNQRLGGDEWMVPNRGVLVFVLCKEVLAFYEDMDRADGGLTYIIPQENGVVACAGVSELGKSDTSTTANEVKQILRRCYETVPALRDAPIVGEFVGLRPQRTRGVCLEVCAPQPAQRDSPHVLNNFGHGGSGIVLSWGCAHTAAVLSQVVAASRNLSLVSHTLIAGVGSVPPPPLSRSALTPKVVALLNRAKSSL